MTSFQKVPYSRLNSRQKENYNFQKVSAVLAEYGFVTMRLSDDWQGADFIGQHVDGKLFIKVQLKSRPAFAKKYQGKDLSSHTVTGPIGTYTRTTKCSIAC